MRSSFFITSILLIMMTTSHAAIVTKPVDYKEGGATLKGLLVYDDTKTGARPGVLVVHEWWGLNGYPKMRAEKLAQIGYVAFCADIYGDGKNTTSPDTAKMWAMAMYGDRDLLRKRVNAALVAMKEQKEVDKSRVAAIGYCFGGAVALELARSGADLAGVVSFHGSLTTPMPAKSGEIKAKIMVCHGADDPFVPAADVTAFEDEMRSAQVEWQLTKYSGAVHAFTNPAAGDDPKKGMAYNELADRRSWNQMLAFFGEIFD